VNFQKYWVKFILLALALFFIFFMLISHTNKAGRYASLGYKYLGIGNYVKAQEYYEKSYNLGNVDSNFRKAYVKALINSPLTIFAQNRLVDFATGEIQDSASDSAKYFLKNFKKEINNKYVNNYIKQAPYNNKIVHWGKMPISYSFKDANSVPKEIIDAIDDAFDTWERASSLKIRFDKTNSLNADIIINFDYTKIKDAEYGRKYVIATTVPSINHDKLKNMTMNLSIYNLEGNPYTPNQIYNTALHEIFHALGFLGHSFDNKNIMYISKDIDIMYNDTRKTLTDADKATLELFYQIQPDITNAKDLKYNYIPYVVIGNDTEINKNKIEEAKYYIRKAPTIPAGYIDLAQTLLNQKKYTAAISYLEKALRLTDNDETKFIIYFNLGVANYYDGNYVIAHFYVQKAEELKKEDELKVLDAEIYSKENKLDESIKIYTELNEKNPNNIEYLIPLTNAYIKEKKYLKARKTLKKYLKNNPNDKNNKRIQGYGILLRI